MISGIHKMRKEAMTLIHGILNIAVKMLNSLVWSMTKTAQDFRCTYLISSEESVFVTSVLLDIVAHLLR